MKSKGDPILDVQAVCAEKPRTEAELIAAVGVLGWAEPVVKDAIGMAKGVYVQEVGGLFHPRTGTTKEVVVKALGDDFKGDREAVADQIIRVVEDPKEVER